MKLLLIESSPGIAREISDHLTAEGHHLLTCHDDFGAPCKGVYQGGDCPVEQHIDLTILARDPQAARTFEEMGSVCATRHRIPMVEVDPRSEVPPAIVAAAVATRAEMAGYANAIRLDLGDLPAIVEVERDDNRIHVTVQVPQEQGSPQALSAVADRARQAVRLRDPFVKIIDVSVLCYAPA